MSGLAVVVLAAGQGTRLKSRLPKVLHPIAGRPMIQYVLDAVSGLTEHRPVLVIGRGAEQVRGLLGDAATYVLQEEQLGTGHAVLQAEGALAGQADVVLVLYGDMPLLSRETIQGLVEAHHEQTAPITMLTCIQDDPMGFGRVLRDGLGCVVGVVEQVEATPEQLAIKELNPGVYCFQAQWLWEQLARLPLRSTGEYYLTDLVQAAVDQGQSVASIPAPDSVETLGVNTRVHLARVEAVVRQRIREHWMEAGVTLVDPATTYIDASVILGEDTIVYPQTHLQGNTCIGAGNQIGPGSIIRDSTVGDNCRLEMSVVEGATLEDDVSVGPFAHLRQGAHLAQGVHMGNFGEVKNSYLGPGAKMGHFSYVGDAAVGAEVNIGAGTVTCNYDGVDKHPTVIDEGAFIGSGTMLVAPVKVGARARVGAGAVVTHDVPPDSTAFGAPARVQDDDAEEDR